MLKAYLEKIVEITLYGDAREESYYSTLENLLIEYAESIGKRDREKIHITTIPKKTEAGNPDFRIWDGTQHITGYIEAKAPYIDLDDVENSRQLKRYRDTFPNLILTNFLEFRLYRDGELIDKISIVKPYVIHQLKTIFPLENREHFLKLFAKFFSFSLPKIRTAKDLARELAKRTRFLRDEVIIEELKKNTPKELIGFYDAFRIYLINGLSKEEFADLYSQTITYELFAARTRADRRFNRKLAYDNIPYTIGILRDIFDFVSLGKLPKPMEVIIDDISNILAITDVKNILHQYYHNGKGKDPIIHFYETFLSEYDPETRERRGVYYTPEPIVNYIVNSLDIIIEEHFNKINGLASDDITILDPAAGTLTFLAEAIRLAVEKFTYKYGEGAKEEFIRDYILKNFYAFELMMAPYAVGHIKISFLLEELGYKLEENERFKLYLTNTLEVDELEQTTIPGLSSLAEESHSANEIKNEIPILVILGNPPYSGHSANKGNWIDDLLKKGYELSNGIKDDGYYKIDGKPLGEKNPKWLQDDYVKFIRFAQWKIDQAGEGVLGFITNHSYLDNPTFRGMRKSLMNSFDNIYILNLHGNALKKEKSPDGSKDMNVFDIKQGVAIAIFIKKKKKGKKAKKECKVNYYEIWGTRENKYEWLFEHNIKTTNWQELTPKSESYFFIPRDEKFLELYEKYIKITNIFPIHSVGIVTARDKLSIKWTKEEVWNTILNFSKMDSELARQTYQLGKDAKDWKVKLAQKDLLDSGLDKNKIVPILYRPFDIRYTYYTGKSNGFHCRPRLEVMKNMLRENLGLITIRRSRENDTWRFAYVSDTITAGATSITALDINYLFPLYTYPKANLFNNNGKVVEKEANINPKIYKLFSKNYQEKPTPEEILYYIYAILYSNIYREKYNEFLKVDFPKIPFTKDYELFIKMGQYGERLINIHLHLSKSLELDPPIAKFQGKGNNEIEKVKYENEKVYINKTQYFENIKKEIWEYKIGGYQVSHKWLKDRKKGKKNKLNAKDIRHYCTIITSLQKTIEIQEEIDNIYIDIEKDIISF